MFSKVPLETQPNPPSQYPGSAPDSPIFVEHLEYLSEVYDPGSAPDSPIFVECIDYLWLFRENMIKVNPTIYS